MARRIVPTTLVVGRRGPEGPASTVPGPRGDVTPEALAALDGAEDARDAAQGAAGAAATSAGQAASSASSAAQSAIDAAMSAQQAANGAVRSINTKTPDANGAVTLTASDVGAATPANITSASTADRDRANHTGTQAASTITGLGSAATKDTGTTSGTVPLLGTGGRLDIARLASGTPTGTKFVADDGSLKVPGGTPPSAQIFDASGTWTKPSGATRHRLIIIGAGSGGYGTDNGGGGGLLVLDILTAEIAASVSVTVGAGGSASSAGGNSSVPLANGQTAIAHGGINGTATAASIGGKALALHGYNATPPTHLCSHTVTAAGGGAGGTGRTDASTTTLAGGAGEAAGSVGRTQPVANAAGLPGDILSQRCGSGGGYNPSGVGYAGGKYGGGGGRTGASSGGVGGQGGVAIISYFD